MKRDVTKADEISRAELLEQRSRNITKKVTVSELRAKIAEVSLCCRSKL